MKNLMLERYDVEKAITCLQSVKGALWDGLYEGKSQEYLINGMIPRNKFRHVCYTIDDQSVDVLNCITHTLTAWVRCNICDQIDLTTYLFKGWNYNISRDTQQQQKQRQALLDAMIAHLEFQRGNVQADYIRLPKLEWFKGEIA